MRRATLALAPFVLVALLLGAWEGLCRGLQVPDYFLPRPSEVALALVERWPLLLEAALRTLVYALSALALASAAALSLAIGAALSRTFESAVRPIAVTLQVTPVVAIAPLAVIWAGLDHADRAVIGLAAVVAFFPIFSGAVRGLNAEDPDLARLFQLYGASRLQTLWRLKLPSAVPFLLEGHRVAIGLAVIGAVVAEFVAGSGQTQGLAWRILEAQNRLRIADMLAAVLILGVLAVALNLSFAWLEHLIMRSRPVSGGLRGGRIHSA